MRRLNGLYQKTSGAPHHRLPAEPPPKGKPELKAKKFFAENFANSPEKRLQFFFGYGIVYKLLMQTEV